MHEFYTSLTEEIPKDLVSSCPDKGSLSNLLDKSYTTPKMHSSIMGVWGPYSSACQIIENEVGEILSYNLNKIVADKLVYRFIYDLEVSKNSNPSHLVLVLNREFGLSEFHIYVQEGKKSRNILFPNM